MSDVASTIDSKSNSAPSGRLICFEVVGLFHEFNYRIPLNVEQRVTAIIAPNGSGKTICLRLINSLFAKQWSFFTTVEFERAEYSFASGYKVTVRRENKPSESDEVANNLGISFAIEYPETDPIFWTPGAIDPKITRSMPIERYLHFLTRRGVNQFIHDHTGETFTLIEVVETFGNHLPSGFLNSLYGAEPPTLNKLIKNIDCHLIETQRLLILRDDPDTSYGARTQRSSLAISKKAQTLKAVIAKELTAYAALSQSLDRSFPKRVISLHKRLILAAENLKSRLIELEQKRASLMEVGILDSEADDPVALPQGPLPEAISRVLSVYAEDTVQKLDSLSKLQSRIELFVELIKQRFLVKDVIVSKENGFSISFRGVMVPLDKLSSGEQHQLVLFFELLFELRENALILIDEPELSLHVAWQKKFISDLHRIIALKKFDVILATHSPQLISRWTDLVVELGKVDAE
jgi:predicted ATP-binding protein involved in virulence